MRAHSIILLVFLLLSSSAYSQEITSEDYKVYSAFFKSEILASHQSVALLKALKNETESSWVIRNLKSGTSQDITDVYFSSRDKNEESIGHLDTSILLLWSKWTDSKSQQTFVSDRFNLTAKVLLVDAFSTKNWKKFYKKNPGSAGIFTLSSILYSESKSVAIFYHEHFRNSLGAHGGFVIMEKIAGEWVVKVHNEEWQS